VPLAEIKTAGVIMAVNTPSDAVRASMLESVAVHSSDFEPARPIRYARLWRAGLRTGDATTPRVVYFQHHRQHSGGVRTELYDILRLRIVAENQYHFVDRWRVKGDVKEVADILEDALALPGWWGSVYFDVKEIEPAAKAVSGN
jgi:hypothetical protein